MTKVDIFSGFLGAGKTTLIRTLIREAYAGEKLVLIENEFGEIGVDGAFLAEAGIEITEMNSGCICCSLVGDFGRALRQVIETYAPERILIEPSGVGKLSDVIRAVADLRDETLALNAFATVVDAKKCKMYMKNFGEFFDNQVEHAKTIFLSHTAGLSENKIAECVALLREKNADAVIVTTDWSELSGAQLLEALQHRDTLSDALSDLEAEAHAHHHHHHDDEECECHGHHHHHHDDEEECECHGHHHHHDDEDCECHEHHHHDDEECECHGHHHHHDHGEECTCGCHDHDGHHHADEVFTSWGCETARRFTREELETILAALENESEYGMVLRAKGFVPSENEWLYFDYVPGTPDVRSGSAAVTGRICVIGSKICEDNLAALFAGGMQ